MLHDTFIGDHLVLIQNESKLNEISQMVSQHSALELQRLVALVKRVDPQLIQIQKNWT